MRKDIISTPHKIIIAKLGFSKGFNCHFHVIPVSSALLQEIVKHPSYTDKEPDGNDVMLFMSREYCERAPSAAEARLVISTVEMLREKIL